MTPQIRRRFAATAFLAALLLQVVIGVPPTQALSALVDPSFDIGAGPNQVVLAVAFQPPDKIIIAGTFTRIGDAEHFRVGRLNANGALDTTFTTAADGTVNALAVQVDGKILIGGSFSNVNGTARRAVARLNTDGTLDGSFQNVSFNSTGSVGSMLVAPDGTILIGGTFTTLNNVSRECLARLAADGTVDPTFNPPAINGSVATIARDAQGRIVIGGHFSTVGGQAREFLARLSSTGVLDATFRPNPGNSQAAIGLQGDASVIAQRGWTNVNGQTVAPLGRFRSADGALDSSFFQAAGVGGGSQPAIYAMDVQPDDRILLGGNFATVNGTPSPGIARLNADGTVDSTFIVGAGVAGGTSITSGVYAIARQPDQRVVIGGDFTTADTETRHRVARLMPGVVSSSYQPDLSVRNRSETRSVGNDVYNVTGVDQTAAQSFAPGLTGVYIVTVQNDGGGGDTFKLNGPVSSSGWAIKYFDSPTGGADITGQVTTSGWTTAALTPGAGRDIRVELTPNASVIEGRPFAITIVATSTNNSNRQDAIVASAKTRRYRGHTLITDQLNHRVIELDADGHIVWQYGTGTAGNGPNQLNWPLRARRLANRNTLIADSLNNRVIEVDLGKSIVWQFDRSSFTNDTGTNVWGRPASAERLRNGNTLITAVGDNSAFNLLPADANYHSLIEVAPNKKVVWEIIAERPNGSPPGDYPYPVHSVRLTNGNTLITHTVPSDVVELTPAKRTVWTYSTGLVDPYGAVRLGNGNTLIADTYNNRVIEVTRSRNIVWKYDTTGNGIDEPDWTLQPFIAHRLATGNTLIATAYRVIEVDRNKNIVWQYGQIYVNGSGPNELYRPFDAQRIGPQ